MTLIAQDVELKTTKMLDAFVRIAADLFEVTGRSTTIYEQGFYGFTIAKPRKRMKSALAIDREVLVIASTFPDQQQRTIKFICKKIEESSGRLESTIAIILHCDPEGNTKLRNWGRDKGISILSIKDGESLSSPENLEKSLCYELYAHDPFDVTGPVSDDTNFFGRRDEAIDLARKLQRGQIRTCLGIRKVGKTSIINRILREIKGSYDCTCLMVDCSQDDIWDLTASQLFNSISASARDSIAAQTNYRTVKPTKSTCTISDARTEFIELLQKTNKPFILVFDEIDYITPGSPTNHSWKTEFNPFWRNLRVAYQECTRQEQTFSILIAGVSAYWFTAESIEGIENAALSFVPEEYLSPMPLRATTAMLRRLGRIAGLSIDESTAEFIAKATGNMPYWTRKCCSYINRQIQITERPCDIKTTRIAPLVDDFVKEEGAAISEVALRHLFRVHPDLRSAVMSCRDGDTTSVQESHKRALRKYGIILSDRDRLSGQMITTAVNNIFASPQEEAATSPQQQAENSGRYGLEEWAEDLAAISKRRNLLEKRMRELALNFLRYDAMTSGKNHELQGRILQILPERQRVNLAHLSSEQIIAKFNWTDLVKLITKEWQQFQRLFGDKDQFSQSCNIINDRPDAHAKPADTADFALYRRALKHLEEQLAKVQ